MGEELFWQLIRMPKINKKTINLVKKGAKLWKSIWRLLRKPKITLPYDSATVLPGIYPEDCIPCHRDTCSSISIAALFTIAGKRRQLRCPTAGDWVRKMWYINTQMERKMKLARKWMELEKLIYARPQRTNASSSLSCDDPSFSILVWWSIWARQEIGSGRG